MRENQNQNQNGRSTEQVTLSVDSRMMHALRVKADLMSGIWGNRVTEYDLLQAGAASMARVARR